MQIRNISNYVLIVYLQGIKFVLPLIWFSVAKVIKCDLYLDYKQSFWNLLHCIPWHQFDSAFDPLGNQPKVVYWDYFFNNFYSSLFIQLHYKKDPVYIFEEVMTLYLITIALRSWIQVFSQCSNKCISLIVAHLRMCKMLISASKNPWVLT